MNILDDLGDMFVYLNIKLDVFDIYWVLLLDHAHLGETCWWEMQDHGLVTNSWLVWCCIGRHGHSSSQWVKDGLLHGSWCQQELLVWLIDLLLCLSELIYDLEVWSMYDL